MNCVICGSKNLIYRNLLHREIHDIDVIVDDYHKNLSRFLRKINIKCDFINKYYNKKTDVDIIFINNKKRYLLKLHWVLYYKIIFSKTTFIKNNSKKHRIDLINVFHNLGREKSLEEIDNIKNNTPINEDDVKELLNLMEIGISNETEI